MTLKTTLASVVAAAYVLTATAALAADKITIVTPYLAQPGTQYYFEAFQDVAKRMVGQSTLSTRRATFGGHQPY